MPRTWFSIQVELVSGRGGARWDLAHLHTFTLSDGTTLPPLLPDGCPDR